VSTASELIRRIDFFQPLDDRLVDRIAHLCITREYSPGDYIVRQGDPGLGLYVITRGTARVEITRDGAVTPIAELHAGEFVGELSIIDKKPRSANVVCTSDASCLLLTRDSFMKLLDKHPEIALQMAKALAARLRSTDERMWQATPATPPPAPQNGAGEPENLRDAQPRSDAQKIKDTLADTVGWIYILKAVTRFSLAVVGCPVEVTMETRASESRVTAIGQLKLVLFPADESHVIGIHAFGEGHVNATVLQPVIAHGFTGIVVSRFSAPVRRDERVLLGVPAFERPRVASRRHSSSAGRFELPVATHCGLRELEAALFDF